MLELYMIRHGLAGQSVEDPTLDDTRPLKKKGKEEIKNLAKSLKTQNISFDIVITSPLLRAKETADIINATCGKTTKVTVSPLLKPGASHSALIKFLNKFKDLDKIAIVGHEPFLSTLASYCLSKSTRSFIHLKKGGVLVLEIEGIVKPGQCTLSMLD